jgi:hypothetical protein
MSFRRYDGDNHIDLEVGGNHHQSNYWVQNETIILYGTVTNGTNISQTIISSEGTYNITGTGNINGNNAGSYMANIGINEGNSEHCNSYIGEMLYYNKVLSEDEENKVLSYLTSKWLISSSSYNINPYNSLPPPILYRISEPEPPVFFTPTKLPNLSLWLDGSDLSSVVLSGTTKDVITWNDKSGLGNNATAVSTPQWLPTYGISLDGTSSYFTLPDNTLPTGDNIYSYYIAASFTGSGNYGIISGGDQNVQNNQFGLQTNGTNIVTTWNQNNISSNYTFTANKLVLIESIYDGTNRYLYFNSSLDVSDTPGTRSQSNSNNVLGSLMSGVIYEVIVYSGVLTNTQRNKIEGYLMSKWIPFNDPKSLPDLTHWVDISDISTLFQDYSANNPVTSYGQSIGYVKDKSSNQYDLRHSGWNAPSYSNQSSLNGIYFGGNSNLITISQVPKTDSVTVFWVGEINNNEYFTALWGHYSNGDIGSNDVALRKFDWSSNVNFGSYDTNSCQIPFNNWNQQGIYWATMTNGVIMNIHSIYPGGIYRSASYTKSSEQWQPGYANIFFSSADWTNNYTNHILHENIYYQRVLSQTEINNILNYLGPKWNITIPSQFSMSKKESKLSLYKAPEISLTLSQPVLPTYSSNQTITLTLSTYYPEIYLYYGTTNTSFYNLSAINNPVTGNNIYTVNLTNNTFTFNISIFTSVGDIMYFYASTSPNYTGISGISLPFYYIDYNTINMSLDHYDVDTNVYNVDITGYNPLLINQPLYVLAIQNNSKYINTGQTLTLSSVNNSNTQYTAQFTYDFPPYNIYNIVICNSYDMTNQPNGDIYYQISNNIYSFTLNASLNNSDIYPGLNSEIINFTIPGLSSNLCVADLIPSGNILINNNPVPNNHLTIIINQININLYKYQNGGFTIWLDAMDPSTLTIDSNNMVSQWNDKSGLDNNGTQSTLIYKPSYDQSTNSIWFKGYAFSVNQEFLNLPFNTFNNTNYYTCSFVFTFNGNDTFIMSKQHDGVNTYALGLFFSGGQYFRWQPVNGHYYDTYLGGLQTGVKYLLTFTYDGSNYRLWRDGNLYNTTSTLYGSIPDDLDVTTCTLGSWHSPSVGDQPVTIEIHEFIFNETYLYDDEIQKIESYLCNKWSIPNTNSNPYLNNIVIFSPNTITNADTITFNTIDDVISIPNTLTGVLVNPVLTLNTSISTNYIITLDDWNSNITTVYLYGGTNNKYFNRTLLAQLSVTYDSNGYYIIVTVNPLPANNYYSIRDTNSSIFNFDLRVSNPSYYLKLTNKLANSNIETSPSTCVLNKNNKLILTLPENSGKLYVYTCETLYTTGKVGSGDRDLTFITIINNSEEPEIRINPTKLPIYILTSSEPNYEGTYYQSNIITEENITLIKNTKINGLLDQENNFSIVLDNKYKNIQVNDSNIIIKHVINNNNIEFTYDPGFELTTTFKIINAKSNEIYEIIDVTFIDPKI